MRRIIHHAPNSGEASVRLVCLRKPIRISRSWIPVMPELMGMKNVLVLNDEAHHCYREKPDDTEFTDEQGNKLTGEELRDARRGPGKTTKPRECGSLESNP